MAAGFLNGFFGSSRIPHDILKPDSLFNQHKADDAFDEICQLNGDHDTDYIEVGIPAQKKGNGNADTPHIYAVEQEGDDRFPAGTEGKICGMHKGILRHKDGLYNDKADSKAAGLGCCIIKPRKHRGDHKHQEGNQCAAKYREGDHLIVGIPGFLHFSGAQELADDDGNGITECDKHHIKYIVDGICNIQAGDDA